MEGFHLIYKQFTASNPGHSVLCVSFTYATFRNSRTLPLEIHEMSCEGMSRSHFLYDDESILFVQGFSDSAALCHLHHIVPSIFAREIFSFVLVCGLRTNPFSRSRIFLSTIIANYIRLFL